MSSLPVGTIITYLGLPTNLSKLNLEGWLLCDGTARTTTQYGLLWNAIGNSFGSTGEGSFNLPDLQGVFLRGVDPTGKVDPDFASRTSPESGNDTVVGATVGSRQGHQLLNHQHFWDNNYGYIRDYGEQISVQLVYPYKNNQGTQPTTNVDGGGSETRPTNVYAYYLIYAGS